MKVGRNSFYRLLLLAAAVLLCPALPAAGEPQVLTVRPDKIGSPAEGGKGESRQLRDPFNWSREQVTYFKSSLPREKRNSIAGLTLTGILFNRKQPLATINDTLVGEGDKIVGAVILEIQEEMVIFEQDGIPQTLWLDSVIMNLPLKNQKP